MLHLPHLFCFARFRGPEGQGGGKWTVLIAMAISSGVTSIPTSAVAVAGLEAAEAHA